MKKTILVTGGSGFIGSAVVNELLSRDFSVVIFDHHMKGNFLQVEEASEDVSLFVGDIASEKDIFEAMAHADGFIHLAGVLGTQETIQNPRPAVMTNIQGGINVLEAAARYDVPGVNIAVGNFWENNPYSISKNSVERFVQMYNAYRGTNVATVRALNAYGPGQSVAAPYGTSKVRKIVPSFISRILHGDPVQVYGDGTQVMDMIHVADVADTLVAALLYVTERQNPEGRQPGYFDTIASFEAGTGVPTSVNDVLDEIIHYLGHGRELVEHLPMRPGETAARPVLADTSTLVPLNGYRSRPFLPRVSLAEGIPRTVEYYRNLFGK